MAVNIVIGAVAALLAVGMSIYITTPIMYALKTDENLWNNTPAEGLAIRDNVYSVFGVLALPLLGMVFLWAYMRSTRRQPDEF